MEIKGYRTGDETEILNLFSKCFGKTMSQEYWNWRFKDNPFSKELYIELMWSDNKLIGHYAVSPVELLVDSKVVFSALSMTTMTDSNYGGKGVFTKLANSLYARLEKNGFNLVWGFPNNNSHYGFIKNLKWENIGIQCTMSLDTFSLSNQENLNVLVHENFNLISNLFNSVDKKVQINKTAKYLNWRYISNPSADYKIITTKDLSSAIVYKKIKSFTQKNQFEIDIVELYHNNEVLDVVSLLTFIKNNNDGVCRFNIWDSLFSNNQLLLEKIGFKLSNHATYFSFCELNTINYVSEYKQWDMSFGYSDIF